MSSAGSPRTLADQLRSWSDEQLTALLVARPDLSAPAPQDTAQLASRAGTKGSVLRVLDRLTRLELGVLEAMVSMGGRASRTGEGGPASRSALDARVYAESIDQPLQRLQELALVWGTDDNLRLVSGVADALPPTLGPSLGTLLAGVGPERVSGLLTDVGLRSSGDRAADVSALCSALSEPATAARLVEECDAAARAMLDHLDRSRAHGTSQSARTLVRAAEASTPVEQLLARGLLASDGGTKVVVPAEVSLGLRNGRTTYEPLDRVPPLETAKRSAALVDKAAAGAAHEVLHRVELLLDHWSSHPVTVLRTGGVGVRDLKGVATLLHTDERTAALLVELVAAAGLLGHGPAGDLDDAWLPTPAYDGWRALPPASRWAALAAAWLRMPRPAGLVGEKVNGKTVNALSPDLERPWLADIRQSALSELAAMTPGEVLAPGSGIASLVDRLAWLRPRRPALATQAVAWAAEEAAVLGVTGLSALSKHGRALISAGPAAAAKALTPLLPEPVDHVLLQADLTAVAPGPLEDDLARDLASLAEVESRGGATVYRFTEASLRNAFDLGWSGTEIHAAIARAARTDVPQPLHYLIDDVARTHGRVRIGTAESFLRSDDESALAALVHDHGAASLRLRLIAPTVAVTSTPPDLLLERLRALGVAPVLEGHDGLVRIAGRATHRAKGPVGRAVLHPEETAARIAARAAATVPALRSGDRSRGTRSAGATSRSSPASVLATLREAAEQESTVWIGYVDNDGSTHDRVVEPQRVDGGWLRAFDQRSEEVRSYAVHRITSVHVMAADEG